MKHTFLPLTLLLLLSACGHSSPTPTTEKPDAEHFLGLFKNISSDTFLIQSADTEENMAKAGFAGQPLDSSSYIFVEDTARIFGTGSTSEQLHACYRFPLSSQVEGLILRTPSDYWDSSIRLFLFDRQKQRTFSNLEAAELWGDAGDILDLSSLLIREPGGWKLLTFQRICHPIDEDNLDDLTCTDSTFTFSITASGISKLAASATDTAKMYPVIRRFDPAQ